MIPVAIGGVVAVGFVDEERLIAGSHGGVGYSTFTVAKESSERMTSATTGTRATHLRSGINPPKECALFVPPGCGAASWTRRPHGWTCHRIEPGVVLSAEDQSDCRIEDSEEFRAQGFSPGGCAFVYATSPTIYLASRMTSLEDRWSYVTPHQGARHPRDLRTPARD